MNKVLGFICLIIFNAILLGQFPNHFGLVELWCIFSGGIYGAVASRSKSRNN